MTGWYFFMQLYILKYVELESDKKSTGNKCFQLVLYFVNFL